MQLADSTPNRGRRRSPVLTTAAAVFGVALLVAACGGGGSNPGVANVSSSKTSSSSSTATGNVNSSSGGGGPSTSTGSPGPGAARSSFAIAGANRSNMLAFAGCMRSHGEPNFPDPGANGVIRGSAIDPASPQFQTASKACRKYMPNGGQPPSPAQQQQMQAQALRFSQCMRAHGVKNFPDPQFQSGGRVGIRIGGGLGSGLDPNSPIFQAAQKACQADLPGRLGRVTAASGR